MKYLDLFQSGQIDLENAEKQFLEEEYMLSAFLAQQALEKHVKAYLLKNDIFDDVKKLGHLPISSVIKNLLDHFKIAAKKSEGVSYENFIRLFEISLDFLIKLEQKEDLKIIIWKSSLGIPLTVNESNISQGIMTQFSQVDSKLKNGMPVMADQFQKMIDLDQLSKIDISKLDKKSRLALEFVKKIHGGLSKTDTISLDDLDYLVHELGYGSGKNSIPEKETNELKVFIKMNRTIVWIDEIINLFPHQTLARYPFKIDGKTNHDLYVEYKDNLHKLINKIKIMCEDIRKTD